MRNFGWIVRTEAKPEPPPSRGAMRCCECHAPIHRYDRYEILVVRHRKCTDPALTGQLSIEETPQQC